MMHFFHLRFSFTSGLVTSGFFLLFFLPRNNESAVLFLSDSSFSNQTNFTHECKVSAYFYSTKNTHEIKCCC